jgi:predicted SAM-dependent methyltransferase
VGGTSLALDRRLRDPRFAEEYFVGRGIDIGAGPNSLEAQDRHFPKMVSCRSWDLQDGDAHAMNGLEPESFDFIYSSHCVEHLENPIGALLRWIALLKPGGYLVVVVPEWELYEHRRWPSQYNGDHKFAWQIIRPQDVAPHIVAVADLCRTLGFAGMETVKIERLERGFRPGEPGDQTADGSCEAGIEFVLRRGPLR